MSSIKLPPLIPVFNSPIQARRNNLTRLLRMPLDACNSPVTSLHLMPHLASLPVPEADISTTVPTGDELAVGTARHVDGIASVVVALEHLLPVLSELVVRAVHEDVVV